MDQSALQRSLAQEEQPDRGWQQLGEMIVHLDPGCVESPEEIGRLRADHDADHGAGQQAAGGSAPGVSGWLLARGRAQMPSSPMKTSMCAISAVSPKGPEDNFKTSPGQFGGDHGKVDQGQRRR